MAGDFSFVEGNVPLNTKWDGYVRDQVITICTSSTRPPDTGLVAGRKIYETDTGNEYRWSGSAWVLSNALSLTSAWTPYTPYWRDITSLITGSGGPAIGNGLINARYRKVGNTLEVALYLLAGSTTTFGSGLWFFSGPLLGTPRFFGTELQIAFNTMIGGHLYDVRPWMVGQGMALGVGTWDIDAIELSGLVMSTTGVPGYYYDPTALPSSSVTGKTNGFWMTPLTASSSSSINLTYVGATAPFTWANGHSMFFSARVEML